MPTPQKVLLIGDSISVGYTPVVAAELAGRFAVAHQEGNSGDTLNVLAHLDGWLAADADAAIIHFNVGLHDLRLWHDSRGRQVPLPDYRANLGRIVRRLQATGAPLVWATTTPVDDERNAATAGEFHRANRDVLAYNTAARDVAQAAGIPVNDLYAVVVAAGPGRYLGGDGVHMTDEGYALLGRAVARAVREHAPG